jgi:APA family basic amino acid/polyamine antiporter
MTVVALFVLRRRRPDLPRPYRATFYPFLPALYLVASAAVVFTKVADAVAPRPGTSLGESLFPLYGVGVFAIAWAAHAGLTRARGKGEVGA